MKFQSKLGSINIQAHGSKDGDLLPLSLVLNPCYEFKSSALARLVDCSLHKP